MKTLSIRYQALVASLIEKIMDHRVEINEIRIKGDLAVRALMRGTPALANALKRKTHEGPALDVLGNQEHAAPKSRLIEDEQAGTAGNAAIE